MRNASQMFKLSLDQVLQLRQKSENSEIFMPLLLMFLEMFIFATPSFTGKINYKNFIFWLEKSCSLELVKNGLKTAVALNFHFG